MKQIEQPFYSTIDLEQKTLHGYTSYEERKLSDMKGYFQNEEARAKQETENNPTVYKVYKVDVPLNEGELLYCITVIEPGHIDGECFMTKGHYHLNEACAEIYIGLKGNGVLLMQKDGKTKTIEMKPNTVAYIPAGWGHRTINVSNQEPFVFFSIWPAQSGYNYQKAIDSPFLKHVFLKAEGYELK